MGSEMCIRDSLRKEDAALFKRASQYSAPTKRNVEEQQRLKNLGLLPGATSSDAEAPGSRTLVKRRARLMAQTRLATMFPRELRAPTLTPPAKGWPQYTPQDE